MKGFYRTEQLQLTCCCISAVTRLLETFLSRDVLRRLSESFLFRRCLAGNRLASLDAPGFLFRPPADEPGMSSVMFTKGINGTALSESIGSRGISVQCMNYVCVV